MLVKEIQNDLQEANLYTDGTNLFKEDSLEVSADHKDNLNFVELNAS